MRGGGPDGADIFHSMRIPADAESWHFRDGSNGSSDIRDDEHVDECGEVSEMKLNKMQLSVMNKASVEALKESNVAGLLINDGKIVGRLDEEEDIQIK